MHTKLVLLLSSLFILPSAFPQGSLTPPGPPGPTMKSLADIDQHITSAGEQRIPIDAEHAGGDDNNEFILNQAGTYYLTARTMGVPGKNGILIKHQDTTIDLNGFDLLGVPGSLAGITDGGSVNGSNATIRNGTVRQWGGNGIDLSQSVDAVLADLLVTTNSGIGVTLGDGAVVRDCLLRNNDGGNMITANDANVAHCSFLLSANGAGLSAGNGAVITGCVASFNALNGIRTGDGAMVYGCLSASNQSDNIAVEQDAVIEHCAANGSVNESGIRLGPNSSASECVATYNKSAGITTGISSVVISRCTTSNNLDGIDVDAADASTVTECTVTNNTNDGISAGSASYIASCHADSNGSSGISTTGPGNRIEGNKVTKNATGIKVNGSANLIIANTARNNGTNGAGNYVIAADNHYGPIVDATAPNATAPAGKGNFASSLNDANGGSHPWANFSY